MFHNDQNFFNNFEIIFWDFDGVIKESLEIKAQSFIELFSDAEENILEKISNHHLKNAGIPRDEKISLYLNWAKKNTSLENVMNYSKRFSKICLNRVISCKYVEGFEMLIQKLHKKCNIIVSACPQKELEFIINYLKIDIYFESINGYPKSKSEIISQKLNNSNECLSKIIMIGDSEVDFKASKENKINFILRKTKYNSKLQNQYKGLKIHDYKRFV